MKKTDWIQTFTGKQFYPLEPDAELICLEDIGHSLAHQCRFGGHCRTFYSVAQHSIIVAQNVPVVDRLEALFHDAAEAYLVDLPRPIKAFMPGYRKYEAKLMAAISKRFDLTPMALTRAKEIDEVVLYWEGVNMMPDVSVWNIKRPELKIESQAFMSWPPESAENRFLEIAKHDIRMRQARKAQVSQDEYIG